MTVAGPSSADDLTVERARQEVVPTQVDGIRDAGELEREIGAADDGGRGGQDRTDVPARQVVHQQDVTLEHVGAQRLGLLEATQLGFGRVERPARRTRHAVGMLAHEAFDDDDTHLAVLDVLLGHDAEAERVAGVGVALRDRVGQGEDGLDRHLVAGLMRPERGEFGGAQRRVALEDEFLEREAQHRGILRSQLLVVQFDLRARDRFRLRSRLQILVGADRLERRRHLPGKGRGRGQNQRGGRDEKGSSDRGENRTKHDVRMLLYILQNRRPLVACDIGQK